MKENKTQRTTDSVAEFLDTILDEKRLEDSKELVNIMAAATGSQAEMWGASIIGFGTHHYIYESGREGDTVAVGFSPRKNALVVYGIIMYEKNVKQAKKLGLIKLGKGCLYIKSLGDVDNTLLSEMISEAFMLRNNAS